MRFLKAAWLIAALSVLLPGLAWADTCSDRQQVCFHYCEKTYAGAPRCLAACSNYLNECLATGCWESRVTAKQCGFERK